MLLVADLVLWRTRSPHTAPADESDCRYDQLSVFAGNTSDGTALVSTCGDRRPADLSVRGPVTVVFTSDYSVGATGFQAEFTVSGRMVVGKVRSTR